MKKLLNKAAKDDRGVAIMFSLIMLSVFFLISFGFVSMATSHKSAAYAREPKQQATLAVDESVLNEALFAIDEGLINGQTPNFAKFREMKFINAADTMSVSLNAWATSSGDDTNLADALPLQVHSSDDFKPDTDTGDNPTWADVGWITYDIDGDGNNDKYAWMVIDSSGIDPNYIGGNATGTITGVRTGEYVREMDIGVIEPTFRSGQVNSIYVNWTTDPPNVWEDKQSLISGLTSSLETAVALFEPGTSPITLTPLNGRYDLSVDPPNAQDVFDNIEWLGSSADTAAARQLACNICDYIDSDNIISNIGTVYGKERVPYINEIAFELIKNNTVPANSGNADPSDDQTPSRLTLTARAEMVNIFEDITTWDEDAGTSPDGSNGRIILTVRVQAERTDADIDSTVTITINPTTQFNAMVNEDYYDAGSGSATVQSTTDSTESDANLYNVKISILNITVLGEASDTSSYWEYVAPGDSSLSTPFKYSSIAAMDTTQDYATYVECSDPRNNQTNAAWRHYDILAFTGTPGNTIGTNNAEYLASNFDGENGTPWSISTAYMPAGGKIEHLTELGFISRGTVTHSINLTDYNLQVTDNTFVANNYKPSGTLDLENPNTFDGGDRGLLEYVIIGDPGAKTATAAGDIASYQQFGAINPNTSRSSVLQLLLKGVSPLVGPSAGSAPSDTSINTMVGFFPGPEASANSGDYFKFDEFHDSDGNNYHSRNPKTYGYPFSTTHTGSISEGILNDAQREALVVQTMNLVSPKYSYFTVLCAVEMFGGSTTSVAAFVRRDNESGSYKILRKSTQ